MRTKSQENTKKTKRKKLVSRREKTEDTERKRERKKRTVTKQGKNDS